MPRSSDGQSVPGRHFGRSIFLALIILLIAFAVIIFLVIGRWLVVEDPPDKAQAIVVLSGRVPMRAIEAARLYTAGLAQEVWLTRPREPAASLQEMHIAYIGEDFYNAHVLMHEGVPSYAIHTLDFPVDNTADEVQAIASELQRSHGTAVIIVTSKLHTRRVRTLWRKLASGRGRAIVRAASTDTVEPARWWRSTTGALDVVRESLGLLNVWAGTPLKPSQ